MNLDDKYKTSEEIRNFPMLEKNEEISNRSIIEGVIQFDQHDNILYWNHIAQKIFDYDDKECINPNIQEILPLETFQVDSERNLFTFLTSPNNPFINNTIEINVRTKRNRVIFIELSVFMNKILENALIIVRDITNRRDYESQVFQVLRFEKLITSISSKFVGNIDFDETINEALAQIGISNRVSRVYLFLFDNEKVYMNNTHEWCAENVSPHIQYYKKLKIENFPEVLETVFKGDFIRIEDTSDFSKGGKKLKELLASRNIKATLAFPIFVNYQVSGFLGFDDEESPRLWSLEDYSLLKITSQIVGTTLERKFVEDNLRESEEKYRLLSEDSDDLIVLCNENLEIEYINGETHERILGYPQHLFWKQEFRFSIIHKDDISISGSLITNGFKKGNFKICIRNRHLKGHYLWFEWTGKFFYDKNYNKKLLVVGREITDFKVAEQKLKESEEKYRKLYISSKDGIVMADLDGYITDCNPAFLDIIGYDEAEIKKYTYMDITVKKFHQFEKEIINSEVLAKGYSSQYEKEYIHKNGKHIPVSLRVWLIQDEIGNNAGMWAIVRDISEQKKAQYQLEESEMKYRNILESIREGYFEVDLKGNFTFINDAMSNITGYLREELLGANYEILCDTKMKDLLYSKYNKLFKSRKEFIMFEYYIITKKRAKIFVESSVYLLKASNKWIIGFKGVLRDVSERKTVETLRKNFMDKLENEVKIRTNELAEALEKQKLYLDQIIRSSHFKTDFLATMSHELRTPLNAIVGFTDLLLEGSYGYLNKDQSEFVQDIKGSAEHQFEMISHILDISRIESGQISVKIENFSIKNLIENICSTIKPLLNKKSLVLEMRGFEKKKIVNGDHLKIKQIIYNLLSNAIKFTEKGKITIEFYENSKSWGIKVKDTGIGIQEKDYGIIFKDFKRVNSEYVNSKPGSGLGLALTKRIVELHRGQITFESKFGEGTTFDFNIPIEFELEKERSDSESFLNL